MEEELKIQYLNIIKNYKLNLEKINKKLKLINSEFKTVFNKQLIDENIINNNIKALVVMDNPGKNEFENNEYLIGKAGKGFNRVINSLSTEKNFIYRNNLLVFNKSTIYTNATNDLNKIYQNEKLKSIFIEEQKNTFEVIFQIHRLLKIPLFVHGYSSYLKNGIKYIDNYKGNRPLYIFFNLLFENYNNKQLKNLIYFYHHSSYGCLEKQIRNYENKTNKTRDFNLFLELGNCNIKGFFE